MLVCTAAQSVVGYQVSGISTPGLFSAAPAVAVDGTLTFSPAPDAFGSSSFTVRVKDNGGIANGSLPGL
jgi:hypothetical protein